MEIFTRLTLMALAILCPLVAKASHYQIVNPDNKEPIQCLVQDLRYPLWTSGQYLACYSQRFKTKENWRGYFYGGFVSRPKDGNALLQFCSWQMKGKGVPAADIAFAHSGKHMSWKKTTWEGSAGGIKGLWAKDELKPDQWKRFVCKTWADPADPTHSYVGIWMKNLESGIWYHLASTRYPGTIVDLGNYFGFEEKFSRNADAIARVDIRNTYTQRNGKWVPSNRFSLKPQGSGERQERVSLKTIENGSAVCLQTLWDYSSKATPEQKANTAFKAETLKLTFKQPAQANFFDPVQVKSLIAHSYGSQLHVKWQLTNKSCPQLAYKVEIFNQANAQETPFKVISGIDPKCHKLLLDLPEGEKALSIRLTLTDIYDRSAKAIVKNSMAIKAPKALAASPSLPGINYRYYQAPKDTSWNKMPDFKKLKALRQGRLSSPDISVRMQRVNYAFQFSGKLNAPADGIYDFSLVHASGALLSIDDKVVIDAREYHSIAKYSGTCVLSKGQHDFKLYHVQGKRQFQQADDFLQLLWTVPGSQGVASAIPAKAFSCQPTTDQASIVLKKPKVDEDGMVTLSAKVSNFEHPSHEIYYYAYNPGFDYFAAQGAQGDSYFLGKTTGSKPLKVRLWPSAKHSVRARLIYAGNSVDSKAVTFSLPETSLGPWKLSELEHHQYPVGAHVEGNKISLLGDSMSLLTQPVTGDVTLIARLAAITPNNEAPDGTRPGGSQWQAGIILRNDLNASPGEPLGGHTHYVSLLGAADGSIRHCDSLMKNGAGNQPSRNLGKKKKWMKLERKGQVFIESLSEDGKSWTEVKRVTLAKMSTTLHAGFFIYALPSSINLLHHASFDNVSLTPAK